MFRRTAVCLLSAQVGWETVLMYPYLRSFLFSFVSLDQLICAAALLAAEIAGCVRNRRWWTIPATLCLMGLSALFQFFRDDKVAFMLESEWLSSNKETICPVVYILISAALIPIALKAVTPRAGKESGKM